MGLTDSIHHHRPGQGMAKQRLLIYFVTGNPGLIDYYHVTLNSLFASLCARDPDSELHVCGTSLPGFGAPVPIEHATGPQPYGLAQQIEYVASRLTATAKKISKGTNGEPVQVVLVGHSIGSYILLEIINKWQCMPVTDRPPVDLVGGICLFPTVVDIAKSDTGRLVAPLLQLPYSTSIAHLCIKLVFFFVPMFIMTLLVRMLTQFEPAAARTTALFIKSTTGVRQALYLAKDEPRTVRSDMWLDSLWGIRPLQDLAALTDATNALRKDSAAPRKRSSMTKGLGVPAPLTRLFFYWAANDHWVADDTRDALMLARGRVPNSKLQQRLTFLGESHKPVMEVDANGIPHAFPVKAAHSRIVADKVADWVGEIMSGLR
ncbi:hypothetical protein LTR53_002778 [Teratosphaeriaceae sp. CCFEE 6253]|nr:hypothetical protein LTR53_002778 [Teratosphaeriaceae sp. CCFEE 6253]